MQHDSITESVIGAAYEVYNVLGHGFSEKVYERALSVELKLRGVKFRTQHSKGVVYKGSSVGVFLADLLVEGVVVVELKAVSEIQKEHLKQCLNYLRAGDWGVGLVMNFGPCRVEAQRVVNGLAK